MLDQNKKNEKKTKFIKTNENFEEKKNYNNG